MSLSALAVLAVLLAPLPFILRHPFMGLVVYYWLAFLAPQGIVYAGPDLPWSLIVAAATVLGYLLSDERKALPQGAIPLLLLAFLAWTTVTLTTAHYPAEGFDKWNEFAKVVFITLMAMNLVNSRERVHALVWVICIALAYHCVKTGLWTVISPGGLAMGPEKSRFSDNNGFSRVAIMVVPLFYYLVLQSAHRLVRWGAVGGLLSAVATMVGANSRGGFVGFAAMMALFLLYARKRVRISLVMALLAGLFVLAVPQERMNAWLGRMETIDKYDTDTSAQGRFESWAYAIQMANQSVLGGGFEAFLAPVHLQADGTYTYRAAHSNYFEVLGEHGWIGLALYLALSIATLWTAFWISRAGGRHPELYWARDMGLALQHSLVGYFIGGLTINHSTFEFYYTLMALTVATAAIVRRKLPALAQTAGGRTGARMAPTMVPQLGQAR